jgi:DNA-binding MarR family transcriptional regulator
VKKASATQSEVLTEVMLEIFRLNSLLLEKGNQMVAPLGMTSARWQVLGALALSGEAISCPQVAAGMGISRQGAQKQLNLAFEDQLLAVKDNPRNLRSPLYELTSAGQEAYGKAMGLQAVWSKALSRGITLSDWQTTLNVLQELDARLHSTLLPNKG